MTKLYVVRHAEAEGNLYRRIHGWYDSCVTEKGMRQIDALVERFREIPVDAVYSSDLLRAKTTALGIAESKDLPLHTNRGLREINLGVWEDLTWAEVGRTDTERLRKFNASERDWSVPGGENYLQACARVRDTVLRIAAAHPDQTVVIVSHGSIIRCLQWELNELPWSERGASGHSDNTAVSCYEIEDGHARAVFENDNSHLTGDLSTLSRQKWWQSEEYTHADSNLWYRSVDIDTESGDYRAFCGRELDGAEALRRQHWDRRAVRWALLGDEVVGLLELDPERPGGIVNLWIRPEYRGQNLGVQLLGEATSVLRPRGVVALYLPSSPNDGWAEHYGFRTQEDGLCKRIDGKRSDES